MECEKSPDKQCHYFTTTDRDGVCCVLLEGQTMDHNFPRSDWVKEYESTKECLYCGEAEVPLL